MLPGHRRLRRTADFRAVLRSGVRASSRTVVVHSARTASERPARAGFIVGGAVGGAVMRKRVTRRLRPLTAAHMAHLSPGTDIVVRALPAAADASPADLDRDLGSAMRRAAVRVGPEPRTAAVVSQ